MKMWALQLSAIVKGEAELRVLGGAEFQTYRKALAAFDKIPDVDESELIVDLIDPEGDIVDDKIVSRETAMTLLGEWIA